MSPAEAAPEISPDQIDAFRRDGAVKLANMFSAQWVDCVVFNSRILHGGSGNLDADRNLEVFTSKWLGDDTRIAFREVGMDPDFSEIMSAHGLDAGDRPGTALLPQVWSAEVT